MQAIKEILFIIGIIILVAACSDSGGSTGPSTNPQEPELAISSVSPKSGPPGTSVTIKGSGFSDIKSDNKILFNETKAAVDSAASDLLKTSVPKEAQTGEVKVTVDGEMVTGPDFTVKEKSPGISLVEPDSGTVGTKVTIKGMNFSSDGSKVTIAFNGTDAPVNSAAEDELKTEVPKGATDGPIKVTVDQKSAQSADFDVITEGTLQTIVTTSGSSKDSDGYTVTIDGSDNSSVGIEDTVVTPNLEKGGHDVEVTGLADNCSITSENPRTMNIAAGDTTSTTFTIECKFVYEEVIAMTSNLANADKDSGVHPDDDTEIYLMAPDGSHLKKLTDNEVDDISPSVSHDGKKIAFLQARSTGGFNLCTMNIDGTNIQKIKELTYNNIQSERVHPSWSPDDKKLAFVEYDKFGPDVKEGYKLYTINTDGSNVKQLTDSTGVNGYVSWSSDKNRIAFSEKRKRALNAPDAGKYHTDIYTIDPQGDNLKLVTTKPKEVGVVDRKPMWSPDGSKIGFLRGDYSYDGNQLNVIYAIKPDGSNLELISSAFRNHNYFSWSPDGSKIVYGAPSGEFDGSIVKINSDGSGSATVIAESVDSQGRVFYVTPFWRNK